MKKYFSNIVSLAILFTAFAGVVAQKKTFPKEKVTIKFKNNSLLPRKYTFVTYWTNDRSNNATEGFILAPNATKTITDVIGTELFIANNLQIDVIMSGDKLSGKPFYVFRIEDHGKTINLRKD